MLHSGYPIIIIPGLLPPPAGLWLEDSLLSRGRPVMAVWRHGRSIIVGRSTQLELEVDCGGARRLGVPVYRRRSGGGAVYHDEGNINFSIILRGTRLYPRTVYHAGHSLMLRLLALLGVRAWVENEGDIVVDGWKVSGSAAYIARDRALFHATLLVEADTSVLHTLIRPRLERVRGGEVTPAKYRPRNLSSMNPSITVRRVLEAVRELAVTTGLTVMEGLPPISPEPAEYQERCGGGSASS